MRHRIDKTEWHYVVEESNYNLIRIFLNDEMVIAQPMYISDDFRKYGFLDKKEILENVPAYVNRVQDIGLKVKVGEVTEDEWSKRTDFYVEFYAYKDEAMVANIANYKIGSRIGSYSGRALKSARQEVNEFMYDIRPKPTDIVKETFGYSIPKGMVKVTYRNGEEELLMENDPRYVEHKYLY